MKNKKKKRSANELKSSQIALDKSTKVEENAGIKSPGIRAINRSVNPYENYETTAGRIDSPLRRGALDGHYGLHQDNPGYHPHRHPGMYGHAWSGADSRGMGPLAGYHPGLGYLPYLEPTSEDIQGKGDHILDHPVHANRRMVERSMEHPDWVHPGVKNDVREKLIRERELELARCVNPNLWNGSMGPGMGGPGPLAMKAEQDYLKSIQFDNNEIPKSQFNVMNGSFIDTGIEATDNRIKFLTFVKGVIEDDKLLEEKRKTLSMRSDFNVTDFFMMIDVGGTGYVSLNDLDHFSTLYKVSVTRTDWENIIARFDMDRDGMLSFSEFSCMWVPFTKTYRTALEGRSAKLCEKFSNYTVQSRKLLKDLLYSVVTSEENFEANKFRLTGGLVVVSNEVFDFIDKNKDGFVTLQEFAACLKENNVKIGKSVLGLLFEKFDRDHDGKISFDDFHTPKQVKIATAFSGTGEGRVPPHALPHGNLSSQHMSMFPWGMGQGGYSMFGMGSQLPHPSNPVPPFMRSGLVTNTSIVKDI